MTLYLKGTSSSVDTQPLVLWDNHYANYTINSSSEASNYEDDNVADENTYDFWQPTSLPAWIEVDAGSNITADCLGISAHDLYTNTCTVLFQSWNGSSWVNEFSQLIANDKTTFFVFDSVTATKFRVYITGSSAPSIGNIFLGEALRFEAGIAPPYTPMYMAQNVEMSGSFSLSGQFIKSYIQRKSYETDVSLNILDRSFIEGTDFQAFLTYYNNGGSFFFASSPEELPEDVSYCKRMDGQTLRPTFQENGIFYTCFMSLKGYV